jgi:hypothetical protein
VTNVVGIDIVPEWPTSPEFTFRTDGSISPAAMAALIANASLSPAKDIARR